MMKRLLSSIFLTTCLCVTASSPWRQSKVAIAQALANDELFYMYLGKRIPLRLRQDAIVVKAKTEQGTSGGTRGDGEPQEQGGEPFYSRLQQYLQSGSRGEGAVSAEIKPLGENYALVNLPGSTETGSAQVLEKIKQFPGVEATLPVMTRQGRKETIALPNEIIVSFDRNISESQIQAILKGQNLEIIRKIPFTRNRYVVLSNSASGTAVLSKANQLIEVAGVKSATPNFIQSLPDRLMASPKAGFNLDRTPDSINQIVNNLASASPARQMPNYTALQPLQWQLYSSPLLQYLNPNVKVGDCLKQRHSNCDSLPRTDIRALEAWQQSNGGRGVVVAAIDSVIQWNHPDLKDNLYSAANLGDRCPGEVHGWNFSAIGTSSSNDSSTCPGNPYTGISRREIATLAPIFQNSFRLSDGKLLAQYPGEASQVKFLYCQSDCPNKEIANWMRYQIRQQVTSSFHGTWASGVIAARSSSRKGLMGVAPNVKILPVRAAGIGGELSNEAIVASIGYAAARGADVINMSFGSSVPIQEVADEISEVLAADPKLVIVASAGNDDVPTVGFPASMRGVVSVGATNLAGNRTAYSNYGTNLDVVAPGGDLSSPEKVGGILTTGGTWLNGFWQGISRPNSAWGTTLDKKGGYIWVEGTSFSAPVVSGVFALMKGEDPKRRLSRQQLIGILKGTASYKGLVVSQSDRSVYDSLREQGNLPANISAERYFFGNGLVNAEAAVKRVKRSASR